MEYRSSHPCFATWIQALGKVNRFLIKCKLALTCITVLHREQLQNVSAGKNVSDRKGQILPPVAKGNQAAMVLSLASDLNMVTSRPACVPARRLSPSSEVSEASQDDRVFLSFAKISSSTCLGS